MNNFIVRPKPIAPKTIYVNINKVSKLIYSKQGLEAGKRFEDNMRLLDYWHPEHTEMVEKEAEQSLYRVIDKLFSKESEADKAAICAYIKTSTVNKIIAAKDIFSNIGFDGIVQSIDEVLKKLKIYQVIQANSESADNAVQENMGEVKSKARSNTEFKNLGIMGDDVLKYAIERDNHLGIVDAVYKEAQNMGLTKLNREQQRTVEAELREAAAYEKKRSEAAQERLDANKENERIAAEKGPDVLKAYQYLFGMPDIGSTKNK